ncbi:uncharacterized protein LOC143376172 isoform X1 [Andrena cerasifolii]|uniref:uncharacterized protein LOC143376172 isoform X1 n=1 Tax=Andrena cerasifolii TaxID=2819439 RepID=UPI0040375FDF
MQNNTLEKAEQFSKTVFETFHALPQETRDAYSKCMSTEAVFFSAIPLGALSAFTTYKLVPFKPSSTVGRVSITIMGLLGYTVGRVYYSLVCLEKHAPSVANMMKNRRSFDTSNYNRRSEPTRSFGQLTEQQPVWSSLDTYSDSNVGLGDELDTFNNSEEELPSDKPINLKPRVTYDTLRNKNRAEYYNNYQGYRFAAKEKPKPDKELMDDTDFKSDSKEDNIWS